MNSENISYWYINWSFVLILVNFISCYWVLRCEAVVFVSVIIVKLLGYVLATGNK